MQPLLSQLERNFAKGYTKGMIWQSALSELFINLSAAWFAAALILPMTTTKFKINSLLLISNTLFGILTLLVAIIIRSNL